MNRLHFFSPKVTIIVVTSPFLLPGIYASIHACAAHPGGADQAQPTLVDLRRRPALPPRVQRPHPPEAQRPRGPRLPGGHRVSTSTAAATTTTEPTTASKQRRASEQSILVLNPPRHDIVFPSAGPRSGSERAHVQRPTAVECVAGRPTKLFGRRGIGSRFAAGACTRQRALERTSWAER